MTMPAQPSMPPEQQPPQQPQPTEPDQNEPDVPPPSGPEKEIAKPPQKDGISMPPMPPQPSQPSAAYVNTGHAPNSNSGH